jgi:formylmethanofuran dehydrogenase subunit C
VIRLTLKSEPPVRLAADLLIPERLAALSPKEIERLPLAVGKRQEHVGDWFLVEGGQSDKIEIVGQCRRIDRIGAGMSRGTITLRGDGGAYLGIGMRGGAVLVDGSVGFGAATALSGGVLRIAGNAGDGLAGALPGAVAGMQGGSVLLGGSAGSGAGQRLKRGLVVIAGAAGPCCGSEMIAGTIVVGGSLGPHAGLAMRRGSILALSGGAALAPTFIDCGTHDFAWLRLLRRHLEGLGEAALVSRLGPLRRLAGDAAVAGRGEVLVAA